MEHLGCRGKTRTHARTPRDRCSAPTGQAGRSAASASPQLGASPAAAGCRPGRRRSARPGAPAALRGPCLLSVLDPPPPAAQPPSKPLRQLLPRLQGRACPPAQHRASRCRRLRPAKASAPLHCARPRAPSMACYSRSAAVASPPQPPPAAATGKRALGLPSAPLRCCSPPSSSILARSPALDAAGAAPPCCPPSGIAPAHAPPDQKAAPPRRHNLSAAHLSGCT